MSTWMKLVRVGPDTYFAEKQKVRFANEHEEIDRRYIVDEVEASALVWGARDIGRTGRQHFPMFQMIRDFSEVLWPGPEETLWLGPDEALQLLEELQRLRRVCRREEFVHGLDGAEILTRWREHVNPSNVDELEEDLDRLEQFLERAGLEDLWVWLW